MIDTIDDDILKEAIQDCFKASLFHVAKKLCNYKDITEKTHLPIIRTLEGPATRKLICVPRGTLKSSLCSVAYPIWLMLNNPNIRILIDSELYANSVTFLREIKGHLQSNQFIQIFGDLRTDVWNESEIVIRNRTKTLKEPTIQVGGIGTTKVGQHYDVIIGDDYNSPSNTANSDQRKKVIDHYQYNQSILEPGGIYLIVGTRYHEEDLIGWIIKNELGFETLDKFKLVPKDKGVRYF